MGFFKHILKNIATIFGPKNIFWHMLMIVITYILVISGFDWDYFQASRSIPRNLFFPAIALGGILPIIVPITLYVIGKMRKHAETIRVAFALGQAAILGSLVSSTYKAFTGRAHPDMSGTLADITREFHFGFWKSGIFWGWPSSHTTIAFGTAFALIALYPKKKAVIALAFPYALYVGLAVSVSIHWFTDFIAGGIIGTVIGLVVGKSFRPYQAK